jgi:hypothetical protein
MDNLLPSSIDPSAAAKGAMVVFGVIPRHRRAYDTVTADSGTVTGVMVKRLNRSRFVRATGHG